MPTVAYLDGEDNMEWLLIIYMGIGVFKGLAKAGNPNPAEKPLWMSLERNPFQRLIGYTFYAFLWPLA